VPDVRRNAALLAGVAAGTVAAVLLRRRRGPETESYGAPGGSDPRAEELRRKLAQARDEAADEDDFEAAGMAAEALVEDEPRPSSPPSGEVDETRGRVHDEARAAAEEMRRAGGFDGP
jgi:hypothetical protein